MVQHSRLPRGLREVADDPAPTVAHVLAPHIPMCSTALPAPGTGDSGPWRRTPRAARGYVAQVRCVDRLVLDLVASLLERSAAAGDPRGRRSRADSRTSATPIGARLDAFVRSDSGRSARSICRPAVTAQFHEPVTLVSVLRNVLRYYFGAISAQPRQPVRLG
jgi:hypothetical protein